MSVQQAMACLMVLKVTRIVLYAHGCHSLSGCLMESPCCPCCDKSQATPLDQQWSV